MSETPKDVQELSEVERMEKRSKIAENKFRSVYDIIRTEKKNRSALASKKPDLRVAELEAEIARLRGSLEWYSKQVNDCRKITIDGERARQALDRDGGSRAVVALSSKTRGSKP